MANRVFQILTSYFPLFGTSNIRHGHHLRGKPPTIARSLKKRLESEQLNRVDPSVSFKVDIGLPIKKLYRSEGIDIWSKKLRDSRKNPKNEEKARKHELNINLDEAKEVWMKLMAPQDIKRLARHYGIFNDLYGDAEFTPILPLEISYALGENRFTGVYRGNVILPNEAQEPPLVKYDAKPDTFWTLIMTTPDGNMQNPNNEYCHWFCTNIPGNLIDRGEQIMDYLRPIPAKGVGYYRYIFVLYKQEKIIDFSAHKKAQPCLLLNERNWNTLEFYRQYQDLLTPAGLAFFQAVWDPTVREFYHTTLGTQEPIFQYDFPKPYIKPQTWFPLKEPFNLYLDKYRDPKEIAKEYLLRKFKNVDPFRAPKPPQKYPHAFPFPKDIPSWLKVEKKKDRLGWGRINDIE